MSRTRPLVVAPHPDDAELAAAALLGPGATVLVLAWCGAHRNTEAERAAKVSGAAYLTLLGFPDGALTHSPDLIRAVEDTVRAVQPTVVAGPPLSDEHQDHAAAARAIRSATRRSPLTVVEYETPSTPPGWEPDTFLSLSPETLAVREAALAEHASQLGHPYCAPGILRARAAVWGQRVGLAAAEAYRTVRRVSV